MYDCNVDRSSNTGYIRTIKNYKWISSWGTKYWENFERNTSQRNIWVDEWSNYCLQAKEYYSYHYFTSEKIVDKY